MPITRTQKGRARYTSHAPPAPAPLLRSDPYVPSALPRGRKPITCRSCKRAKRKCDGLSPCGGCQKHGTTWDCKYELRDPVKRPHQDNQSIQRLSDRCIDLRVNCKICDDKPVREAVAVRSIEGWNDSHPTPELLGAMERVSDFSREKGSLIEVMGGSLNLERFGAGTESENLDRVITYLNRAVPVLVLAVRLAREHAIRRQISPSLPDDESDEDGDDEHSLLGYPTSYPPPRHLSIHPPPPTAYYPSSSIPVASSSTPNTDAFVPTNLDYPEQGPSNGHSGQVGNFDGHGSEALGGEMLGSFANMQLGFDYAPHDPTAMVQEESTTVNPSWLDLSLPQPQYPGQLHSRHGAPLAYSQLDLSYLAESHF